jgi:hypothetical protein
MIIESIIKRKKGTKVELGDMTYFFNATETEPRHLCTVDNQDHINRFLSIKEGYREAEGSAPKSNKENEMLLGSSELPALVAIAEGKEVALGDIVRGAFIISALTVSDWNDQDEDDRENAIQDYVNFLIKQEETENPATRAKETSPEQKDEADNKSAESAAPAAPKTENAPNPEQKAAVSTEFNRDALLAEAKSLKIKSAHLFGNERLAQAVAAAKANG